MQEELKIYIDSVDEIEQKLNAIGANFTKELETKDIYFNQPGMVLKVTQTNNQALLTQLQAQNGGFKFIKEDVLEDAETTIRDLESKYGILCTLSKIKRFWEYKDYNINLNLFDDIGYFLIVEGKSVKPEFFTDILGLENPKYLTKSFAQLKLEGDC